MWVFEVALTLDSRGENGLHLFPYFCTDQRFVTSGILYTFIRNYTLIVWVNQYFMQKICEALEKIAK